MVAQPQRGVSLFELLTVLLIVAALGTLAAPPFSRALAEQRLRQAGTELRVSLAAARSESVKRSSGVALISQNGIWSTGWCLEPSVSSTCSAAPIQQFNVDSKRVTVSIADSGDSSRLSFNASGRVVGCPRFTISASAGTDTTCSICLSVSTDGRVSSHSGVCGDSCGDSDDDGAWAASCL